MHRKGWRKCLVPRSLSSPMMTGDIWMTFVLLWEQSFSPKEELVQSCSGENQLYYLTGNGYSSSRCVLCCGPASLKALKHFQEKHGSCNTASPCSLRCFLQQGFRQVRSNLDFQNECWKLEANRANVAFRHMSFDSHNILKISIFLYTNAD